VRKKFAAYSSVAIIESPDSFIVQHRPNLKPGTLANAGKYQLLGGHRDIVNGEIEPADEAVSRELHEETNLGQLPVSDFSRYWKGPFEGRDKYDKPILRHVSCFHLGLSAVQAASMELSKREGDIVHIPKDPEALISSPTD
jgi:ADP-ribose pyrophosphatase YjhB (NUDIX family)